MPRTRDNERGGARRRALVVPLLAALGWTAMACGDDPFAIDWQSNPDTVVLFSLSRPEIGLASGFNFNSRVSVQIEAADATGQWDLAVDTRQGGLVFLPPTFFGIESRARIATLAGLRFDDVREAPLDSTAYVTDRPVPVQTGSVYVVQTDRGFDPFGRRCVFFAKLEPLDIDMGEQSVRFVFDNNPVCNDADLVPPED